MRLSYRAPYDWDSMLEFLAARAIPGVEEAAAGVYRRTFSARRARRGSGGAPRPPPAGARGASACRGSRVASADPGARPRHVRPRRGHDCHRKASGERPVPASARPATSGAARAGRVGSLRDGGESGPRRVDGRSRRLGLVRSRAASRPQGRQRPARSRPSRIFPSAEAVAHAKLDGVSPGHARTIRSLARAALSSADEESLLRVPGLGESTSQYVALRAFRRPDAFPADDPTLHDVAGASERWRPWRAYAAMHLWRAGVPRD